MNTLSTRTLPKLKTIVRSTVREELQDILSDPDFGFTLRNGARARLLASQRSKKAGRVISADDLVKRLGLQV